MGSCWRKQFLVNLSTCEINEEVKMDRSFGALLYFLLLSLSLKDISKVPPDELFDAPLRDA